MLTFALARGFFFPIREQRAVSVFRMRDCQSIKWNIFGRRATGSIMMSLRAIEKKKISFKRFSEGAGEGWVTFDGHRRKGFNYHPLNDLAII